MPGLPVAARGASGGGARLLLLAGTALFLALQLLIFLGYHSDIGKLSLQLQHEGALEKQLTTLVEDNQQLRAANKELYEHLAALQAGIPAAGSSVAGAAVASSSKVGLRGRASVAGDARHTRHKAATDSAAGKDQRQPEEQHADNWVNGGALQQPLPEYPPGNEVTGCVGEPVDVAGVVAAVVVITFNRPNYLRRSLESVLAVRGATEGAATKFPLFVSQDGSHHGVSALAKGYAPDIHYLQHIEQEEPQPLSFKENVAYYRIANHYKFILMQIFDCFKYPKIVILEDDMELAPDFFPFFEAGAGLLDADASLYCMSSWNDHGQNQFVRDPMRLYRSDFFPGLGWMMSSELWAELGPQWPKSYWDDWMRLGKIRRGRQCVRPEVCRTYNFGERGASKGLFYRRYLQPIRLNDVQVPWASLDLGYLAPLRYQRWMNATLAAARTVSVSEVAEAVGDVKVLYDSQEQYERITARLRMLREWKDGVPRGGYQGVVVVHVQEARVFIAPSPDFRPPDTSQQVFTDSTGAVIRRRRSRLRQRAESIRHFDRDNSVWVDDEGLSD